MKSLRSLMTLIAFCATALFAAAQSPVQNRIDLAPGESNAEPTTVSGDTGLSVQSLLNGLTPLQLAQSIVSGSGVTVSNVTYVGTNVSAGSFTTSDPSIVGFTSGIMLSTGNVASVIGPNVGDSTSTNNGGGSDPQLQAIIPGYTLYDTCKLEFDFTTTALAAGQTGAVNFNFVFSSEEYNEYVNTSFNDVFGFFLNGQNIAKLQDLVTPVEIDTVNGGNPYSAGGGVNHSQYRNNDLSDGGGTIDIEMDGLTVVLTAHGTITGPGPHHIKLAIADAGDQVYDSNVFIQGASLVTGAAPTFIAPTPTSALNLTVGVPASWQIHAVANNGMPLGAVTMNAGAVTFDANFAGTPTAATAPFGYSPAFPVTGQPAATTVNWTPAAAAVGSWTFAYSAVDNQGIAVNHTVLVNVNPAAVVGPSFIAPTPLQTLNLTVGIPATWTVKGQANNNSVGANVTLTQGGVTFAAGFNSAPVAATAPFAYAPALPVTGQPAQTTVNWTPTGTQVGAWVFTYHLVDNQGHPTNHSINVNVSPAITSGPVAIAPSPSADIETPIYQPVSWEVHAISNGGALGSTCTIQSVTAEFKAQFNGSSVSVPMPFTHTPSLPVSGQEAIAVAYWVPTMAQVGEWVFAYHLVDNLGQYTDYEVLVNVENGALILGVQPTYIPLGSFANDGLRVEPIMILAISNGYVPELVVPNDPNLIGLEIYVQAIVWDTALYPTDPFKASATLKMTIEVSNSTYAPGSGLLLTAQDIAQLDQPLPLDFTNPF